MAHILTKITKTGDAVYLFGFGDNRYSTTPRRTDAFKFPTEETAREIAAMIDNDFHAERAA